ncbi:MAG: hypothetical protein ACREJU_02365 [Nitrospiraceae bacterium]
MTTEGSSHSRSPVVSKILHYLVEHPDAKDTTDGILKWWFPVKDRERKKKEVQCAVDELVARGWIVQRETTPSHVVYGLDKQHLKRITEALRSDSTDDAKE